MTGFPVRMADFKGAILVAACFAVMVLQGCGGGGGSVASTPAPVATPTATATPTPTPTPTATSTPAAVFETAEYRRSTGPSQHSAIPAWQLGANGTGVTLAIIDSGIDTANPEFAGRISAASDDIAGNRGLINADSDHGTQVALTAAAARNSSGIEGIAWNATIQALRIDSPGTCTDTDGCTFIDPNITTAIDRAVSAGAKVINLSLGGSPPNQALSAAVARAAAAGIVIVVSAGNDGETNPVEPDAFASGLRQAGNGNVIIAGSVDSNGVISSFANPAGSEAAWYLSALGERVCCVYENGQIKVTTDSSGQQFVTVVSGTSYAAPQVAGALTLLRQYFPNLTAVQAVDLLLKTATDAGAAGSDAVYGRGILNIAAAFAPQGPTALAGNASALIPLSGAAVTTSAAMGDASQSALLQAVVLDSYQRAYQVNLGLNGAAASFPLTDVLAGPVSDLGGQAGNIAFGFSVARDRFGALRLSPADAAAARVLAGRAIVRLTRDSRLGFAMARGAEALVAELDARYRPSFLTMQDPASQFGFARDSLSSAAFRHDMAGWGLTAAVERGRVRPDPSERWKPGLHARLAGEGFARIALAFDRRIGPLSPHAAASWLFEDRTVLGARFASGLGVKGARSLFVDAGSGLELGRKWRLDGVWRQGWTRVANGGSVAAHSAFTSNGWEVSLTRRDLFQGGDSLSLGLSQPLRVASGGIGLTLPSTYDYQTLSATYAVTRIGLTPRGREIDREVAWQGRLFGGSATASLFWRSDPGHFAAMADDFGMGLRWKTGF